MGFEDFTCNNITLNLTLGSSVENSENYLQINSQKKIQFLPSLTLSLSPEKDHDDDDRDRDRDRDRDDHMVQQLSSIISGVSSYSNYSRIKRERDVNNYEEEDDQDNNNYEDGGGGSRKKLRLSKEQSDILEDSFKVHSTLNPKQKQELAKRLSLRPRQVEVWFQNRRARTKLKQTEVDCELLKNYCDTLKTENTRLRKELQELKILKLPLPASTTTSTTTSTSHSLCPSCEKIYGGSGEKPSRISFSIGTRQQPHIYNPFAKPSAAC